MMFGVQTRLLAFALAASAIVSVLLAVHLWGRSIGIKHDAKRSAPIIAGLQSDLKSCQVNVDTLTVSLERQNAAVEALAVEADERTRRANEAVREAQEQAKGLRGKIARLERAKPSGDVCEASRTLIVETLGEDR